MLVSIKTSFSQNGTNKEEFTPMICRIEKDAQVDTAHWQKYLLENLKLDLMTQDTIATGVYNITALFVIDKEGCISNIKILDDPGYGLGRKVVQVLASYTSKWIPAEMNGRKVRAYRKQLFTIEVRNGKCSEKMSEGFIL